MSKRRPSVLFAFRVDTPIIHPIAAKEGDVIVVQPGTDRPVMLMREAPPNYGAVLERFESGALSSLGDPDAALAALRELARQTPPPAPKQRLRRRSA
jgi:hypothetical protein